ncbi:hypothetical protein HDU81_001107 [Chytriomyces hyalinus]|nr:hypothetical protein HDU81_001107 [Chytriomyces hyalinus]
MWDEGATGRHAEVPERTLFEQVRSSEVQTAPEFDSDSEDDIPIPEVPTVTETVPVVPTVPERVQQAPAVPEPAPQTHDSDTEFDQAMPSTPPSLRPQRNKRPPGEWWKLDNRKNVHYAFMTMDEALQGPDAPKWKAAVEKELNNFKHFNAFELVDLPLGKKAIGSL